MDPRLILTLDEWRAYVGDLLAPHGLSADQIRWRASPPLRVRHPKLIVPCPHCSAPIGHIDPVLCAGRCDCGFQTPSLRIRRVPNLWARRRRQVWMRDGGCCRGCGAKLSAHAYTVDHILPRFAGGTDDLENLQVLCRTCHSRKTRADGQLMRAGILRPIPRR